MAAFDGTLRSTLLAPLIGLIAALLLPASALAIDEFPLTNPCPPAPVGEPGTCQPAGIAAGPDGALWFTEENGNRIGRITTAGAITEYTTGLSAGARPAEIVAGPDGRLWFTESGRTHIGAINPATGQITEYPGTNVAPDGITVGPDGFLWFTEYSDTSGNSWIGKINPANGAMNQYMLPNGSAPSDIVTAPDGALWFTKTDAIGRITTATPPTITTPTTLAAGSDPGGITVSGGFLWFSEFGVSRIGRITIAGGAPSEFATGSGPSSIATGADGALWFTETTAHKIGRMASNGFLTNEFPTPTQPSDPGGIAAGPDGALWFTEFGGNKIGRIATGSTFVPPPPATPQAVASVLSLRLSPRTFRAARAGASISAKVGTTVTYRLSISATTRFTVERETVGRKRGKKCVRATPRNRRAKRCKRYVAVRGSFSHRGKAGSNRFKFTGRVSRKRLRPGRYRLVAVATAGTTKSALKRTSFRIVRR